MEVTELTAETFWKGETEIRGTVMDGEDEYRVRILRKGSQNFDYSCSHISKTGRNLGFCGVSCTQGPDGIPMCPHAHALLAEWIRRESRESKHPVSTSQKVRFMVREYTNREVSRIMGASEEGHYRLIPRDLAGTGEGPLHGGTGETVPGEGSDRLRESDGKHESCPVRKRTGFPPQSPGF